MNQAINPFRKMSIHHSICSHLDNLFRQSKRKNKR